MKIAVSAGHNVYVGNNFDCGATSRGIKESDITKQTVAKLIPILIDKGHIVKDVTPYNQKFATQKEHHILRCSIADEFKADIYLDVHINSGGGTGAEVWVYNNNGIANMYGNRILDSLVRECNLNNRGVKINPNYWSLCLCKTPAMIIEGAFVDNITDMQKLDASKYAIAIAKCFPTINSKPIPIAPKSPKREENKMDKELVEKQLYSVACSINSVMANLYTELDKLKINLKAIQDLKTYMDQNLK